MNWGPLTPYLTLIKWGLFAGIIGGAVLFGRGCGIRAGAVELAELKAEHAKALAEAATAMQEAADKARAAEIAVAQSFAKIHDQHATDMKQAQANEDATVAAILADPRRLRPEWRCPQVPATAGPAGSEQGGHDHAQLRAEGAGALIGDADRADADIRKWQARWAALKTEYDRYRKEIAQ